MNFINILDSLYEEFAEYGKSSNDKGKGSYAIYSDPTKREMGQIIKEEKPIGFRLLADKNYKKVYLFNANMFHNEAIVALTGKSDQGSSRWVRGYANLYGEIEEFYPVGEVLNIIDWADKSQALTWPNKTEDKKDYLEVKKKKDDEQKRLNKELKPSLEKSLKRLEDKKKKQKEEDKKAMGESTLGSILESFVDFGKNSSYGSHKKTDYGIYKNPTSKEYRDLMKETDFKGFRILVDRKKKDYYLFSSELLHDDAELAVYKKNYTTERGGNYFKGFAKRNGEIMFFRLMDPKIEREVRPWITKGPLTWPIEEGR